MKYLKIFCLPRIPSLLIVCHDHNLDFWFPWVTALGFYGRDVSLNVDSALSLSLSQATRFLLNLFPCLPAFWLRGLVTSVWLSAPWVPLWPCCFSAVSASPVVKSSETHHLLLYSGLSSIVIGNHIIYQPTPLVDVWFFEAQALIPIWLFSALPGNYCILFIILNFIVPTSLPLQMVCLFFVEKILVIRLKLLFFPP